MTVIFIIGLLFLAAAVVLIMRAIALPRLRMATHLRQIETYGFNAGLSDENALGPPPPLGRSINALAESIGRSAIASVGTLRPLPSRVLASAGYYRISVEAFHGYRVLAAVTVPALLVFETLATGHGLALALLVGAFAATACWTLFGTTVRRRSEARLEGIDRELPELIDVLIATIEAGLGFAGSLQLVAGRFEGPLGNELRLALQEQRMGLSTNQALEQHTRALRHAGHALLRAGGRPGRDARCLNRHDDAQPRPGDAHAPPPDRAGARSEGAAEDALPPGLPDLPLDVHRAALPRRS